MLQQLGGLWRWLQEQSPARQAVMVAVPIVVAALLVLGGLMVWSASQSINRSVPAVVAQVDPTATPSGEAKPVVVTLTVSPTPRQVPTQAVVVPGRTATPVAPPTSTPTPQPTNTPTPAPARSARVANTDGEGANMRRSPSVSSPKVKVVAEGTVVELIGEEQHGDGYVWRNIRDVDGSRGFVIVEYLDPIQGPPGATAVLPPPSIQVEEITSPVARGKEATLTIATRPGVRCELRILVFGPSTLPSEGLGVIKADADGICSWTWKVPEEVLPGVWRYRISAGEGDGRAVREVPVVVS